MVVKGRKYFPFRLPPESHTALKRITTSCPESPDGPPALITSNCGQMLIGDFKGRVFFSFVFQLQGLPFDLSYQFRYYHHGFWLSRGWTRICLANRGQIPVYGTERSWLLTFFPYRTQLFLVGLESYFTNSGTNKAWHCSRTQVLLKSLPISGQLPVD